MPPDVGPFNPPSYAVSETAPAIAEISRTAGRDEVVSMTGVALADQCAFTIFSQAAGAQHGAVTSVAPLVADDTAATLLLPVTLPAWSMYLIWPSRGADHGKAIAINRTEAWWTGPEKGVPGEAVSVYGRNLAHANGKTRSHVYIKPTGRPGWYLRPRSVNPFRVEFQIPDLPAATYEVWMHNGHGGRYGWSGPLKLEILAKSPWAGQDQNVVDVTRFGAIGNGVVDDTHAVEQALEAAGNSAPATIYFPKGDFRISATLHAPAEVTWRGAGMDETKIRLARVIKESMIVSPGDNVRFQNLTLVGDGKTDGHPVVSLSSARDIRFEAMRIDAWGGPALDAQDVRGLSIYASELVENGSFYGTSRQVFFIDNKFRMTRYGESVVALWGGSDFSMIGNELTNADESRDDGHGIGRFFVGQAHFGSLRNLYWERNVSRNAAPHDCDKVDCNKGEQICFEIVGSQLIDRFIRASATTVTFGALPNRGEQIKSGLDLVIVGGRGAGQHRHIVSTSGFRVVLERAWNVIPDKTSRFALAATASRAAIYDNAFQGRDSYAQHDSDSTGVLLYGNVYDVVVDSNNISRMRHGMMTVALDSTRGLSPFFLQYSNNRVSQSNSGLYVGTTFADSGVAGIWGGLGNVYRGNIFEDIAYIGVEYETWDHSGSDYNGTVFDRNRFDGVRYGFVDAYKLMWTHDGRFESGPRSGRSRRINTVLHGNKFSRGATRLEGSMGFLTMHPDNTWLNIGSRWTDFSGGNAGPPL
ncbi:polygalacturonase [Rhizobium sp. Root482]|nr:polygalacturonase [Rhizobium sp. Root482]